MTFPGAALTSRSALTTVRHFQRALPGGIAVEIECIAKKP